MKNDLWERSHLRKRHGMEENNIWLPSSVKWNPSEGIIVVVDMDGSSCIRQRSEELERHHITFSWELLKLLQHYGIPFTVATGRSSTSAMGVLKSTRVHDHMRLPMITEWWAALVCPQTQQVIHANTLSSEAFDESYKLISDIRDQIFSVSYYPIVQSDNATIIPWSIDSWFPSISSLLNSCDWTAFSDHATFWIHEKDWKADPQRLSSLYGAHYASHTSDLESFFVQAEYDRVCQLRVHARDPHASQSQTMKQALRDACSTHISTHIHTVVQGSIAHITPVWIDKKHWLIQLMRDIQNPTTIVYIGNDINDLPIMQRDGQHPQIVNLVKVWVGELMNNFWDDKKVQLDYHVAGPERVHEALDQAIRDHIRWSSKRRMSW